MSQRGVYGKPLMGADVYYVQRGSSLGTWIVGGLLVGGAVLWAKHQSNQLEKLYTTSGLPYEGFARSLGVRTRELSGVAREKFHGLTQRFGTRKELDDGT
jgi:hypothetical protein